MSLARLLPLLGLIIVAIFSVVELLKWRNPDNVIGKRHKLLRVALIMLIESLFGLIFAAPVIIHDKDIIAELVFWSVCLTIAVLACVLAVFDVREVIKEIAYLKLRSLQELMEDTRGGGK